MKAFWALMALLAIAAVVLLAKDFGASAGTPATAAPETPPARSSSPIPPEPSSPAQSPQEIPASPLATKPVEPTTTPEPAAAPSTTPSPEAQTTTQPAATRTPEPEPVAPPDAHTTQPTQTEASVSPMDPKQEPPPLPIDPIAPAEQKPEPAPEVDNPTPVSTEDDNILIKMRKEIEAERAKREAEAKAAQANSGDPGAAPSASTPAAKPAASGVFGEAAAEMKPDGSILVEGKFVIKGQGTQAAPYKITWDHLISAERDYAPKDGKKTIPARIEALDDKWVEVTGYVTFPLMADQTDELLAMMNQWDGCCIGIPPTPYDAIEVRLSTPVTGDARLTTYGTIKGRFKVDPHLVGGWLVGLYVIDQGKLTPAAYGGVAP